MSVKMVPWLGSDATCFCEGHCSCQTGPKTSGLQLARCDWSKIRRQPKHDQTKKRMPSA